MPDIPPRNPRRSALLMPVFVPAVLVIVVLVLATIADPERVGAVFARALATVTRDFGWFYMLAVASFLLFIVSVALSSWGNIKLGPDHAEPSYSFPAWFAMLFSAGYGIALLFFGVAEPVLHFADPPVGEPQTVAAAKQAMQIAFFHWGFHIWGIYGLVGLVLAYFAFRHGLPLAMRSTLYPLIGERIYGVPGHVVDTFAILGTLFGIATTLGLSATQINAGLNYLWPAMPVGVAAQVAIIAVVTLMAIISVVLGMDRGIKRLSIVNMVLAIALLLFVFMAGPSIFLLEAFLENTGSYLSNIVERTFSLQAYTSSRWMGDWTLFIFGWTIAWAPFVGLFIARISRGRTIREFVLGVLLVPTLFTFLWFTVFGDTALYLILFEGQASLIDAVQADKAVALFRLYEQLPFTMVVSIISVLLITTFFVTSSDSGSLVVDALASGGAIDTPVWQRVFWASLQGLIAAVLLVAGGLSALQTGAIVSALPFACVMLVAMIGMWRALVIDGRHARGLLLHPSGTARPVAEDDHTWRRRLAQLVDFPDRSQVQAFLADVVVPAMQAVSGELAARQLQVAVIHDVAIPHAMLTVRGGTRLDFAYEVRVRELEKPDFAFPEQPPPAHAEGHLWYRAEVFLRAGGQAYDVYGYRKAELIHDMLDQFGHYLTVLEHTPGILPWQADAEPAPEIGSGSRESEG